MTIQSNTVSYLQHKENVFQGEKFPVCNDWGLFKQEIKLYLFEEWVELGKLSGGSEYLYPILEEKGAMKKGFYKEEIINVCVCKRPA